MKKEIEFLRKNQKLLIIEEIEKDEIYNVYMRNDDYRYDIDLIDKRITVLDYDYDTGSWYDVETEALTDEEYRFFKDLIYSK